MSTPVALHQFSLVHHAEQDRLLLRVKLTDLSEFKFWLTRRFVCLFAPHLIKILHAGLSGNEQQTAAIAGFQHEQVMAEANFNDPFDVKVSSYPLGEEPLLLSQFQVTPLANGLHQITLLPGAGEGINLVVDKRIASLLCKLLEDALVASEWGLDFHVVPNQSDCPAELTESIVRH